jgi:RNA polymerase sigma-70 factor (ECF subfamily)
MPDDPAPIADPSDSLVVRAKTDRQAFGELYDLHHRAIYSYCVRRLSERAAAEDACSNVFLTIAKKMHAFPGRTDEDFRRWAYRIATHEINANFRRAGRRTVLIAEAAQTGRLTRPTEEPAAHSPAEHMDDVRHAMAALSLRDQAILELRYFDGLTHQDIAAVLKLRQGAVRTAVSRALEKLRQRLDPKS